MGHAGHRASVLGLVPGWQRHLRYKGQAKTELAVVREAGLFLAGLGISACVRPSFSASPVHQGESCGRDRGSPD